LDEDTSVTSDTPDTQAAADRPLVLIVDDNERNLKLARDVLRAAGFRTLEAASGAQAMALADKQLPDVVLLDLRLPDLDGMDVARALRDGARTRRIPVVALSALRLEAEDRWLADAGFAGSIPKPINVTEFPKHVRRYLRGGC
jgi:two-component system cell cycle response regulator DivK